MEAFLLEFQRLGPEGALVNFGVAIDPTKAGEKELELE